MNKKKKTVIIKASVSVIVISLFLFLIAPYSISAIVLHVVFDRRFYTQEYLRFSVSDFEGLQAEKHVFSSDGQALVGYRYYSEDTVPKGVVVLSHGFGGGGQNGYLDVSYYFVQHGYEVFAYDAAGNDESGGKVGGLERGVKNLNSAISYVKSSEAASLPVVLWGHSWGGYSAVCSLKFNDGVKAVASVAGFNRTSDMIEARGVEYAGALSKIFLPYVRSVEKIKFGELASLCGTEAARDSAAGVLIAHGGKDETVPAKYGYDEYYDAFSSDSRFRFLRYEDKGHTDILYSLEGWEYTQTLNDKTENVDKQKLCKRLNAELFDKIVTFYDEYIQKT